MRSPAEQFLIDFHAALPGATAEAFGALPVQFRGQSFVSSYAVLATAVPADRSPLAVLDLACGSGFLLSLLAARRQPGLELTGVDMSAEELRLAAADLAGRARLIEARAQQLPLAARSIDAVVCHLALMLMGEADPVLAELRRVLKSGGTLAAVVGASNPPSAAFDAYVRVINSHASGSFLRLGDARFRTEEGIRAMFAAQWQGLALDEIHSRRRLTPDETWAWFMRMYDIHQIGEGQRDEVRREYLSSVASHCGADGRLDFPQAFRFVQAQAA